MKLTPTRRQSSNRRTAGLRTNARGLSTPVTHALTLAITGLLLVGLLSASGSFLQDQEDFAARDQVDTVGNRVANQIQQVAQFASQSGEATVFTNVPRRIVGTEYQLRLESGSTCETDTFHTDQCIYVSMVDSDLTQKFPIKTPGSVDITMTQVDGTTMGLTATETSGAAAANTNVALSQSTTQNVGIGRSIQRNTYGRVIDPTNRPPIPKLTFQPEFPTTNTPIILNGSTSRDSDGSVEFHHWYVNGTELASTNETVEPSLGAGRHNVTLVVEDDEGATARRSRTLSVSGLSYNNDMVSSAGGGGGSGGVCSEFSMTNTWPNPVRVTHLSIDPPSNVNKIEQNGGDDEIRFDFGDDGSYERSYNMDDDEEAFSDAPDGKVLSLREMGGSPLTVAAGQTVAASVCKFKGGGALMGQDIYPEFGFRYWINGVTNRTVFNGSANPSVYNYEVETTGSGVHVSFDASEQLASFSGEIGSGGSSTAFSKAAFSETSSGSSYSYEATFSRSSGTYYARLDDAENTQGTEPVGLPKNDSTAIFGGGGTYVWQTDGDWDAAQSSVGVVHDSYGDYDEDRVQLGRPTGSIDSSLVSHWAFDSGSAADIFGSNDGSIQGSPSITTGVAGTSALSFDGDDDHIRVPDDSSLEMSNDDEVTVSMWVDIQDKDDGWRALLQKSDESYNMQLDNGDNFEMTIYDSDWYSTDDEDLDQTTNRYEHVVGVFDGATIRTYVDGSFIDSNGAPDEIDEATSHDLGIAENLDATGRHVDARIDDIRLYDEALGSNQIDKLYNITKGSIVTDKRTGSELDSDNLKLNYDADIQSGTTIKVTVFTDEGGGGPPGGGPPGGGPPGGGPPGSANSKSDTITLTAADSGSGSVDISGINEDADTFWVRAELNSGSTKKSPELNAIEVTEGS